MKTISEAGAAATISPTVPTSYKRKQINVNGVGMENKNKQTNGITTDGAANGFYGVDPFFLKWTLRDVVNVAKHHWLPCFLGFGLLFFMAVEYTLRMVPSSSPPFDLGFVVTRRLHGLLSSWPELNTSLAGLNTVFVGMQTVYILWTWLVEGRPRATISALFMFTCRGILGFSTQLPLPEEFLGSGADFPVGNVSFFLFFSGHVAGSLIASLDMRRMQRWELARAFDLLNVLQVIRLLGTRGHYTIDLAAGVGAGVLFDSLAGKYVECKQRKPITNTVTARDGRRLF